MTPVIVQKFIKWLVRENLFFPEIKYIGYFVKPGIFIILNIVNRPLWQNAPLKINRQIGFNIQNFQNKLTFFIKIFGSLCSLQRDNQPITWASLHNYLSFSFKKNWLLKVSTVELALTSNNWTNSDLCSDWFYSLNHPPDQEGSQMKQQSQKSLCRFN
jgi:hypothetical protein